MHKKVTMTMIAKKKGSVAWHGDTGHNAFQIIADLIDRLLSRGEEEEVHFSIVVEGVGGQAIIATPENIKRHAQAAMVSLGLLHFSQENQEEEENQEEGNLCEHCKEEPIRYTYMGVNLCYCCAEEVGMIDAKEDML